MKNVERLRGVIELFLENSARINDKKKKKYWYPLSMATYGVDEILDALDSMCSFRTTMWEKTKKFERKFAEYIGCSEAVMVNSGSSADLILAHLLKKTLIKNNSQKDTVIIPAVTWPTQIWSIKNAGFKVRLVDVDPKTLNVNLTSLKNAIDKNTAAIFLVHLMGSPCDIFEVYKIVENTYKDIIVLEDCCEALGSELDNIKVGNFGLGGAYSFFFSHHITTMEGGMVVLNSKDLADQARVMRAHGWTRNINFAEKIGFDPRYTFIDTGFNLRPTELQAAFGLQQLKKLNDFNKIRDQLSTKFFKYISKKKTLRCPDIITGSVKVSWLGLPVMVEKDAKFSRNDIVQHLEENGVETRPIVAGNIAKHPVASKVDIDIFNPLVGADEIHFQGFYIGLSPMFNKDKIDKLIKVFDEFLTKHGD